MEQTVATFFTVFKHNKKESIFNKRNYVELLILELLKLYIFLFSCCFAI